MTGMHQFVRTMGLIVIAHSFLAQSVLPKYVNALWNSMRNSSSAPHNRSYSLASTLGSRGVQSGLDQRLKVRLVEFARCG